MAKIVKRTQSAGHIVTTLGNVAYVFKRPFKGAIHYDVLVDGGNGLKKTGEVATTLEEAQEKLEKYVATWA